MMEYLNVLMDPKFSPKDAAPVPTKTHKTFLDLEYLESLFRFRALTRIVQVYKIFNIIIFIIYHLLL